jgi:FKBP-type peptidyl-prolyl cis-trans isomerase
MKFKLLNILVLVATLSSLTGCLSKIVLEDDLIVQQNETQIQQYISANKLTMQKDVNGVYYVVTRANTEGRQMILGDTVRLHYVFTRLDGVKIDSSSTLKNQPFTFFNNGSNTNIFLRMLPKMREGEQATFILPSSLVLGADALTNVLPANSPIRCDITSLKTFGEEADIDHYIAKNKITVTEKTTELVRYIRNQVGAADLVTGKVAKIKYTGRFLDGRIFDTNTNTTDSLNITVGSTTGAIQGFLIGVNKMKLGEKATFIFRSALGYGTTGNSKIPGETPLIFDVEIVALKDK